MNFWFSGTLEGDLNIAGSPTIILSALVLCILMLGLLLPRKNQKRKFFGWEMLCWVLAAVGLVFVLSDPILSSKVQKKEQSRAVVLIDDSLSMSIRDQGVPRSQTALKFFEEIRAKIDGPVEVFAFNTKIQTGLPQEFMGKGTDMMSSLYSVQDRYLGQDLRGIIMITDGIDRGSFSQVLDNDQERLKDMLPKLDAPINIYQVATPGEIYDASVVDVASGGFAYTRSPFVIKAKVQGKPGETLDVALYKDDKVVQTRMPTKLGRSLKIPQKKKVDLDSDGIGLVEFTVKPQEAGRFAWEVRIPVAPTDAAPQNNRYPVVLRVVRSQYRVLQVCGSPSYDQKFLRLFLKQDLSVDLVSFFILRTNEDMDAGWSGDELSLIAFPYEQLFSDELENFDVVIFQNFDYAPYFGFRAENLLGNIADYVREGHGFVMIGGDRSFDFGEYSGTPIEEILPIQLGVSGVLSSDQRFTPLLTKAGAFHPITQISSISGDNERIWSNLSKMDGYNKNQGLVPGGAALLSHPTETVNGSPMPILAVREAGQGRVMSLSVDSSWRWSFSEAVEGSGNQAYLRFWKNSLQWLVGDPEDRKVVVTPSKENTKVNEEFTISLRVRDVRYQPKKGAKVSGEIISPSGKKIPFEHETGELGAYDMPFVPVEQGTYYVRAKYGGDSAKSVFAVTAREPEFMDIIPEKKYMQELANYYDGTLHFSPAEPTLNDGASRTITEKKNISLAGAPAFLLWIMLFSGIAIFLRRRGGRA